jgi:hypothetical protein
LNVTKATWIPLKVILPKQATPWYQFVVLAVWTYLLTQEKINIAFRYTGSGKNPLDFQVDDVQVLGSKLF